MSIFIVLFFVVFLFSFPSVASNTARSSSQVLRITEGDVLTSSIATYTALSTQVPRQPTSLSNLIKLHQSQGSDNATNQYESIKVVDLSPSTPSPPSLQPSVAPPLHSPSTGLGFMKAEVLAQTQKTRNDHPVSTEPDMTRLGRLVDNPSPVHRLDQAKHDHTGQAHRQAVAWGRRNDPEEISWLQITAIFLVPVVAVAILFGWGTACLAASGAFRESGEAGANLPQTVYLMMFLLSLMFTIVIPESYSLTKSLGGSAALSGLVVGIVTVCVGIPNVTFWFWMRVNPEIWREARRIFLFSAILVTLAGVMYLWAVVAVDLRHQGMDSPHNSPLFALVMFARCLQGVAMGSAGTIFKYLMVHKIKVEHQASTNAKIYFSSILGMGLGPVVAAVSRGSSLFALEYLRESQVGFSFSSVGAVQAFLLAPLFCLGACRFPKMTETWDWQESDRSLSNSHGIQFVQSSSETRANVGVWKKVALCACVVFSMLRAYVWMGCEVASVMILEVEYGWSVTSSGLAVGMTFLGVIPLKIIFSSLIGHFRTSTWVRILLGSGVVGSLFLFEFVCHGMAPPGPHRRMWCVITLLFADLLMYSPLGFATGLVDGIGLQSCAKKGVWQVSNYLMWTSLAIDCVGRGAGCVMARYMVDTGGRNLYAFQQATAILLMWVLAEICILHCAIEKGERREEKSAA